jgi:O-antigen ligase
MRSLAYGALWLFCFAVPWENIVLIPGLGTLSRLLGIISVTLALLAVVVSGRFRRWHSFHVAAVLFVAFTGIVLMLFNTVGKVPNKFGTYVQLLLMLWVIWELASTRRRMLDLLLAYVLGAYVTALSTILVSRTHSGASYRFAAHGFDPNDLANICALALPMAWYLGMTYRQPLLRWICRGYLLVGLLALGLTGSRGGMLAGMVALTIVPMTMTRLSPSKLAMGIALLGISGTLAVAYIPETTLERLASTRTELAGGSLGGRIRIWRAGVEAFLDRPILGYGAGQFQPAIHPILRDTPASHNSFLTVLVEQGIIGFVLYAMIFAAVFFAVLKLPLLERRFALVLFATLFVAMFPLSWDDTKSAWFILAALVGISQAGVDRVTAVEQLPGIRRPGPRAQARTAPRSRPPLTAPVRRAEGDVGG